MLLKNKIEYFSLIVFLLTAIFSIGHHQADEYFQVLEFAQYKLGHISANELPWEFHEKMRPSIQVWIAVAFIKTFNFLGISDPFIITTIIRLINAAFLWTIITKLNERLIQLHFPEQRSANLYRFASYFLWFIPYISVRFSSENYSAAFLLIGMYFLLKDLNLKKIVLASIFLAIATLFRFQMGLAVMGIYLWLLIKSNARFYHIALSTLPFLCIIAFGSFLDYQFYEEAVFTPFNYLKLNLIEGKAASFGTSPWWFYIVNFLLVAIPPISIILLVFFIIGVKKLNNDIFVWALTPFVLIHFLIGHKEMRFLFPIAYLFIFISTYGYIAFYKQREMKKSVRKVIRFSIGLNIFLLFIMTFKPANEMLPVYRYIYKHLDEGNGKLISRDTESYKLMAGIKSTFYTPDYAFSEVVNSNDELESFLNENEVDSCFYIHNKYEFLSNIEGYTFNKVYCIYPDWIKKIDGYDWQSIISTHSVYLVNKTEKKSYE